MPKLMSDVSKDLVYRMNKYVLKTSSQDPTAAMNYFESSILVEEIRQKVEFLMQSIDPDISPIKLEMYESAALKLYSDLTSSRRCKKMYKAMDLDTLKRMWIEEWSAKGLDKNILEGIWDEVWSIIKSAAQRRMQKIVRSYLMRMK